MKRILPVLWSMASRIWGPFNGWRSLVRFTLLLAPWLIALAVTPLRPLLVHNDVQDLSELWNNIWGTDEEISKQEAKKAMARQHPGNLALQYYAMLPDEYDYQYGSSIYSQTPPSPTIVDVTPNTRRINQLIEKFPRENWLHAKRLEERLEDFRNDSRIAAPFESTKFIRQPYMRHKHDSSRSFVGDYIVPKVSSKAVKPPGAPPGKASSIDILPSLTKPVLPPALKKVLETELAVVQKARSGEPTNSYYDWFAMRYLFALWRDDEAIAVLRQSAGKNNYDSHLREREKARFEAKKLLERRWPQQLQRQYAETRSEDLITRRHVLQLIVARGARFEKRGEHRQALQIYEDAGHLVALMRAGAYSVKEALAACAFAEIVWGGATRIVKPKEVRAADGNMRGRTWMQLAAQKYAAYARAHGRSDLARQAIKEGKDFGDYRAKIETRLDMPTGWPRQPTSAYLILTAVSVVISTFLVQWFLLVCYRIFTFFVLAPAGLKNAPISKRDVFFNMLVTALGAMVCGIAAGWIIGVLEITGSFPPFNRTYGAAPDIAAGMLLAHEFLMPIIGTAFYCAIVTVWRQEKERRKTGDSWPERARARLKAMRNFDRPFRAYFPASDLSAIVLGWGVVFSALLGLGLVEYTALAEWQGWKKVIDLPLFGPSEVIAIGLILLIPSTPVALLGWLAKWRWAANPRWRANAHYALNWYRQTQSWWTILIGWFFLGSAIALLPVTEKVEQEMLASIEKGEVALLLVAK